MRTSGLLTLIALLALPLGGCLFGGAAALSPLEVAGRYRFTAFTLDPASDAVRDYRVLGNEVTDDVTLLLTEDGTVRLERLRGDRVDEALASGRYTISGRTVRVTFTSGDVGSFFMPSQIDFEGGGERLRAEAFQEGVNLERISNEYRGVTRADVTARMELREI